MTERRPAHESVPDFVERQIREAQERGDFDDLPGAGRPQPGLDRPHDELWWVKRKLRDERVVGLPPALRARQDRDRSLAAALRASDEGEVRRIVGEVNRRIARVNRSTWYGPPTSTGPLDVDEVVARWRASRDDDLPAAGSSGSGDGPESPRGPSAGGGRRTAPRRGWITRVVRWVASAARRRR